MYGTIAPTKLEKIEVFKTPPGQAQVFCIRSESVLAFHAHWRGRSLFCIGEDCPWCGEGLTRQWRGFIAVLKAPNVPGVIEVSADAYDRWEEIAQGRSLYGTVVSIARRSEKAPAVPAKIRTDELFSWPCVKTVDLLDQVCRLFSIPPRSQYCTDEAWGFAVGASYRSELDHAPVFRLSHHTPRLERKNLA